MPANHSDIEKRLWVFADELRANSFLKSSEYSAPVLGLIFLRCADQKFSEAEAEISKQSTSRRKVGKTDYQARGVMYLPDEARFSHLLNLPEGVNLAKAINEAMMVIERENEELKDVLPKTYTLLENSTIVRLMQALASVPIGIEADELSRIYEYFVGKFALDEGRNGGEFFTPTAIVKLIVEVLEPFHGRIFDPTCGSGGMFVQSARFVQNHQKNPTAEITVYGQEKTKETVRLGKMNLAVHGLSGDIREGNSYYEDLHASLGKFDFVMANPPFNVGRVDKWRIMDDKRLPFGIPRADNANYLWIQYFYSALNATGRAGFVMINSASEGRASELEIRRQMIEARAVDVMIAIGPNFFYSHKLPCTLWFLDRGKQQTDRRDKVLFIDARHIYQQINRAHREFTPAHIELLANIVRLYRGEAPETVNDSAAWLNEAFPQDKYVDVPGLCKVATLKDIEAQGWSLNPDRYVGISNNPAAKRFSFIARPKNERMSKAIMNKNLKVFLCHSSGDKPAVRDLYKRLKADGINPWLDEEDLLPGQDWQVEIPKAVRTSDIVLVCLSKGSVTKTGYVQKEIKQALDAADEQPENTIYIIPLKLEDCDVPERLSRWHWVDLVEDRGYEQLLRSLIARAESKQSRS